MVFIKLDRGIINVQIARGDIVLDNNGMYHYVLLFDKPEVTCDVVVGDE